MPRTDAPPPIVAEKVPQEGTPTAPLADRLAAGRARRADVPRSAAAAWSPPADRADPLEILRAGDSGRLPELVPIRYGRMLESPFTFLRGAAAVMAADLATTPVSGIAVQASGDAHLANFGIYGTPERNLVFDIKDFDETLPGPWEWDLKRLAASVVVAGRANGLSAPACTDAALATARCYRERVAALAPARQLDVWYARVDAAAVMIAVSGGSRETAERELAQAGRREHLQSLAKLATMRDGRPRILDDPPLVAHASDSRLGDRLPTLLRRYRASLQEDRRALLGRFAIADFARKVVGVGSVGTRCYIVLLTGNGDDDPLFLQIKEARASVLAAHLGPSGHNNEGKRVVQGQRLLQAASDIFLGWGGVGGTHYYLRQLRDMKGSVRIPSLGAGALRAYGASCGEALARAHARSADAAPIAGYLGAGGAFDRAVASFAHAYADQTERDYAALVAAVKAGRVAATTGV